MSSFRRKPNGGIESKDAPSVAAMPQGTAAQLPPVSEAPKQPVEIEAEPTPVEKAAASALRDRIAEMDRAEALVQQSSAPQPSAIEPQQQAALPVPAAVQQFLADNPQYLRDAVSQAELHLATMKCVRDGKKWDEPDFVPALERYLRVASAINHKSNGGSVELEPQPAPAAAPRPAAPAQRQAPAISYSAPPTREAPSMSTGRPIGRAAPLTAAELEIAQQCGQSPEEYQQVKERLRKQGLIGGNHGQ